jgi:hypothetical protein
MCVSLCSSLSQCCRRDFTLYVAILSLVYKQLNLLTTQHWADMVHGPGQKMRSVTTCPGARKAHCMGSFLHFIDIS